LLQHTENKTIISQKTGPGFIFFPIINEKTRLEQQKIGTGSVSFTPICTKYKTPISIKLDLLLFAAENKLASDRTL
jgi:hypothetical protein